MISRVSEDLYGFLWDDYRQNNCNSFLINKSSKVLIDPGYIQLFAHVEKGLFSLGLTPDDIELVLVTHGHPDHLQGAKIFEGRAKFAMSKLEYEFINQVPRYATQVPEPDFFLTSGTLDYRDIRLRVIETPGHSPGGISLYWPEKKALFCGDLVFQQGIGRTDLPGGNSSKLKESIRKLKNLDMDYLLCGHGNIISGKKEIRENLRIIQEHYFQYL